MTGRIDGAIDDVPATITNRDSGTRDDCSDPEGTGAPTAVHPWPGPWNEVIDGPIHDEEPSMGPRIGPVSGSTSGERPVGVGPHPEPWPTGDHYDPELLAHGDRRNVIDAYRYWTVEAIVADLDTRRHPFHVAIENWSSDMNIGTVVRNANAFNAAGVHIIGHRRWNRRGAMVTDRYLHVHHHSDTDGFVAWARRADLAVIGIDNLTGSVPLEDFALPEACVLLFGQEGPGLSDAARDVASAVCSIQMYGSTRSVNAGVASGIAMYAWARQHAGTTVEVLG